MSAIRKFQLQLYKFAFIEYIKMLVAKQKGQKQQAQKHGEAKSKLNNTFAKCKSVSFEKFQVSDRAKSQEMGAGRAKCS